MRKRWVEVVCLVACCGFLWGCTEDGGDGSGVDDFHAIDRGNVDDALAGQESATGAQAPGPDRVVDGVEDEMEHEEPESSEPIVLPVRVMLLQSEASAVHSSLGDADVETIFATVNEIWAQAEIRFVVESTVRVQAQNEGAFVEALEGEGRAGPGVLQDLYPADAILEDGFNVVFVEDFGAMPPGVYHCGSGVVLIAQYFGVNASRVVPPNVLAHELGHALSLKHACGNGENLMCADGRRPTALSVDQIEAAVAQARFGLPFACDR
jgi:hypothetical protein